jgi:hypothetical protein
MKHTHKDISIQSITVEVMLERMLNEKYSKSTKWTNQKLFRVSYH